MEVSKSSLKEGSNHFKRLVYGMTLNKKVDNDRDFSIIP